MKFNTYTFRTNSMSCSGNLQTFTICLGLISTTPNAVDFGKRTQNNGQYAVQGHSRSPHSIQTESPYATSYRCIIVVPSYLAPFPRYRRLLVKFSMLSGEGASTRGEAACLSLMQFAAYIYIQGYLHVIYALHRTCYYRNPPPGHISPIALFAALHLLSGTL